MIVPIVVGALHGGITDVLREVGRVFSELPETELTILGTVADMQKTFLVDSDTIIEKVFSGLVQTED